MRRVIACVAGFCLAGCAGSGAATAVTDDTLAAGETLAAADTSPPSDSAADSQAPDAAAADTAGAEAGVSDGGPVWIAGKRRLTGAAYFFTATGVGAIEQQKAVTGAKAYLLDFPEVATPVAADGSFGFSGLAEGGEFTVAVVHPDYFPSLSPIITVGATDVSGVNFQVVTQLIAVYLGVLVGFDSSNPSQCQMVVTVTAAGDNQQLWWAPGEPGATVNVTPTPTPEHGPFYFNKSVVPDKALTMTTTDGGVLVAGAAPGVYTWTAHKDGTPFSSQRLRCVGGWLTNGVPPFGLQAAAGGK